MLFLIAATAIGFGLVAFVLYGAWDERDNNRGHAVGNGWPPRAPSSAPSDQREHYDR